jgi:hypothetical protein
MSSMSAVLQRIPGDGFTMFIDRIIDQIADAVVARVHRLLHQSAEPRIAPRWVDLEGAAQLMNTTKDAVRGMARARLFPVKKMGGRVMIDIRDLEKAFNENTAWM